MTRAIVVLSNLPDQTSAQTLARRVIDEHAGACVNILAPCRSIYRWEGAVEEANEVPVLIKTSAERYAALEALIREVHPYTTPEIIALPVVAGLPAYLQWVEDETRQAKRA